MRISDWSSDVCSSDLAVSSFYIGIAGALWAFVYTGSVEALAFQIDRSFQVLFMVIIGGLGSILGSFLGAAFIVLLPILLSNVPSIGRAPCRERVCQYV